ncbi:MAG TPA: MBL fold metallo-hydrolase [Casimicrobiaceae bacterium]|jgi:glyoxylase-like metal-dependent hydrolase (beta-lactamase superfamily II)|nr:MBL fold metallo-hydrolase [Casimicrobiaceae bacterium]
MRDFHQLFDTTSSTFTYLLVAPPTGEAVIIDPVDTHLDAYLRLFEREGLTLRYALETHAHADHVTSSGLLCLQTGAKAGAPVHCGILPADLQLEDGAEIHFGGETIRAIHTPGHTAGSMSYLWRECAFTGDALLIGGCGRTDFQSGDAGTLYDSVTGRLFSLPDTTRVYPAHDYHGRTVSTIGEEKRSNPRFAGKSRDEFVRLMDSLHLPTPRLLDVAVPANQRLGLDVQQA